MNEWKNKSTTPESGKIIEIKGSDFMGEYIMQGMFVDYKVPRKINRRLTLTKRFCNLDGSSNMKEWKECDGWRYKNERTE